MASFSLLALGLYREGSSLAFEESFLWVVSVTTKQMPRNTTNKLEMTHNAVPRLACVLPP